MEENFNLEDNLKEFKQEYDVSVIAPKDIKNEKELKDWVISIAPKVQEYFDIERGDYFWEKEDDNFNGRTVVKLMFFGLIIIRIKMDKYQFYRNEIVRNNETGKFNLSVSDNPNDTLLKEDVERISLYRSFTEKDMSYLWYITDKRDYIFVTKKNGEYNHDYMDFGGFNK